jgi:hypothetical protein
LRAVEQAVLTLYGASNLSGRRVVGLNETSLVAFSFEWIAPDGIRVHAGTFRLGVIGNFACAEDDVTLTGTPVWVYAQMARPSGTPTIEYSSTEPTSGEDYFRVPLFRFASSGYVYSLEQICHVGDIIIDSPLR